MKDERMKVLSILEKETIAADEAARLLEILGADSGDENKEERMKILSMLEQEVIAADETAGLLQVLLKNGKNAEPGAEFQMKFQNFSQNMESFAKEVSSKASAAYKEMEPKLKTATRVVVEKTAHIVDELSKSIHESLDKMRKDEGQKDDKPEGSREN